MLLVLVPCQSVPIMSREETMIVRDFDPVSRTVVRLSNLPYLQWESRLGRNRPLRNPVLGWATIATAAVPPAELAMVSTRSVREKFFSMVGWLRYSCGQWPLSQIDHQKSLHWLFFRPTPLGFRQVVQHVQLHVI